MGKMKDLDIRRHNEDPSFREDKRRADEKEARERASREDAPNPVASRYFAGR